MDRSGMGTHGMEGMMGGWDIAEMIGSLFGLFFMVGLVALILFVALRIFSGRQGLGRPDSAENILKERFARGVRLADPYDARRGGEDERDTRIGQARDAERATPEHTEFPAWCGGKHDLAGERRVSFCAYGERVIPFGHVNGP